MIAWSTVALLRPWWLLGLPAIALCAIHVALRAGRARDWERAVDAELLAAMARRGGLLAGAARRNLAAFVVASAIVVALAGPALERADADSFRNLDATLVVVDLSHAVAEDGALQEERIAARTVADSVGTRQVGLIVYAGDAYVANTLTTDADALGATISALEADTVPDPGNRPSRALSLARRTLHEAGIVDADVVLISSGDSIDASSMSEAHQLVASGYRLHTMLASPPGRPAGDPQRRAALATLASSGGGIAATSGHPDRLLRYVGTRPVERLGSSALSVLAWQDLGRAALAVAAASSLLLFRRRA